MYVANMEDALTVIESGGLGDHTPDVLKVFLLEYEKGHQHLDLFLLSGPRFAAVLDRTGIALDAYPNAAKAMASHPSARR
jgi:hypothetical protein